ncbi:MAG: cytochrome c biogenesis protein CcdA [Actinobacteria bacterium]|nr:cytochrome c biogenesis protein CcdA [Actinomycetota bacterium]
MDSSVLLGGSAIAAVVAGTIALLAPCCFSVMLPAYFASSVQNRRALVGMTFLFAAGVATVILPLALGAVALRRLLVEGHTYVYVGGGVIVLALAAYTLVGGELRLPMPGRAPAGRTGPWGVYTLGTFSGVASACCAPVLAGVVALAGVGGSLAAGAGLGLAYVLGMVAPLFVLALAWDRWGERAARLLKPRTFTWRIGPLRRSLSGSALASGVLLALMGGGMIWVGVAGEAMPAATGWQANFTVALQRAGRAVTDALGWVPAWAAALALVGTVAALGRLAWRQTRTHADLASTDAPTCSAAADDTDNPETTRAHIDA